MSHRSTPPMRTAAASGSAKRAMRVASVDLLEALTPNETWLERGGLDHKIEIIIRAVATGLALSATDAGAAVFSGRR